MAHPIFPQPQTTRRSLLKSAVFGSVAAIAAPYVNPCSRQACATSMAYSRKITGSL